MRAAGGVALVAFGFTHRAGGLERLCDLIVQLHAVGHDHERPVARHLAQHLLREEHHRIGFSRTLGLPENTQLTGLGNDVSGWSALTPDRKSTRLNSSHANNSYAV